MADLSKIEMLSQPLMTSEGFVNPAAINELEATISQMGKTHDRLAHDSEWADKKGRWTFRHDIVGAFAMWACRQSPYGVPDGLENVCKYLHAALASCSDWDTAGMTEASLCEISRWLHEVLYEKGVAEFDAWNHCKSGPALDIQFTSSFDGPRNPDREFIDLGALLHNVCLTIRDERRKNKAFDEQFEREYGKLPS